MNRGLMLLGACVIAFGAPRPAVAQFGSPEVSVTETLAKLGAKAATTNIPPDLELGRSITASLVSVEKIEQYGIKGMHEGARVTVTRVGPDRIRVEADELEPVSAKSVVTLRIGSDGTLVPVAEHASAKAPPERG
jgi:hypothetical protein